MTSLPDRPNTAVIVVDLQNGVVKGAPRRDEVIANINELVGRARAADVPVVWVQHQSDELPEGSDQWQAAPGRTAAVVTTGAVDFSAAPG